MKFRLPKNILAKEEHLNFYFLLKKKTESFGWFPTLTIYFEGQILALFDKAAKLGKTFRNAYNFWGWLTLQDILNGWVAEGVASNPQDFNPPSSNPQTNSENVFLLQTLNSVGIWSILLLLPNKLAGRNKQVRSFKKH